jgi:hypothetical protein
MMSPYSIAVAPRLSRITRAIVRMTACVATDIGLMDAV